MVYGQAYGWDAVPLERLLAARRRLPAVHRQRRQDHGPGRAVVRRRARRRASGGLPDGLRPGREHHHRHARRGRDLGRGRVGAHHHGVGGRPCRCGSRGCLEAYVGAEAILERYGLPLAAGIRQDEETALASLVAGTDERAPRSSMRPRSTWAPVSRPGQPVRPGADRPRRLGRPAAWRADPARRPRGGPAAFAHAPVRADVHRAGRAWPGRGRARCRDAADGAIPLRHLAARSRRPGRGIRPVNSIFGFLRLFTAARACHERSCRSHSS